jgi:hypothetical protein
MQPSLEVSCLDNLQTLTGCSSTRTGVKRIRDESEQSKKEQKPGNLQGRILSRIEQLPLDMAEQLVQYISFFDTIMLGQVTKQFRHNMGNWDIYKEVIESMYLPTLPMHPRSISGFLIVIISA